MLRISVLNGKGGVGKTTSAVNIAVALAERGARVLLVDVDAQSHVALHLGVEVSEGRDLATVLANRKSLADAIYETPYPNLSLVPSTGRLEAVERALATRNRPLDVLWRSLRNVADFDIVLMDCPPALSVMTKNAMRASTHLVVVTTLDNFSVGGMDRLGEVIGELTDDYEEGFAAISGVLITKFDQRCSKANRANYDDLLMAFGGDNIFFKTRIRTDQECNTAKRRGRSVLDVATSRAATDYRAVTTELAERISIERYVTTYSMPHVKQASRSIFN